jgi:hypothetical protein
MVNPYYSLTHPPTKASQFTRSDTAHAKQVYKYRSVSLIATVPQQYSSDAQVKLNFYHLKARNGQDFYASEFFGTDMILISYGLPSLPR